MEVKKEMFEQSLKNSTSLSILRERKGSEYNSLIEKSLGFEYPMHSFEHILCTEPSTAMCSYAPANKETIEHQTMVPKSKLIKPGNIIRPSMSSNEPGNLKKSNERTIASTKSSKSHNDEMNGKINAKSSLLASPKNLGNDSVSATPSRFGSSPKPYSRDSYRSPSAIARSDLASITSPPVPRRQIIKPPLPKPRATNTANRPLVRSSRLACQPHRRPDIEKMSIIDYSRSTRGRRLSESMSAQRQTGKIVRSATVSRSFAQAHHLRRIRDMFAKLDSDYDGLISADRIDISQVHGAQLKVICPVLFDMEANGDVLDCESFERRVLDLTNKLTLFDKQSVFYPTSGKSSHRQSTSNSAKVNISDLDIQQTGRHQARQTSQGRPRSSHTRRHSPLQRRTATRTPYVTQVYMRHIHTQPPVDGVCAAGMCGVAELDCRY